MRKPASVGPQVHELIRERWSPRAFDDRAVEPEALRSLLEAAQWAPSSYNQQPWTFIVATRERPEEHRRLLDCLVPFNQAWARQAPVLMLSVAKLDFDAGEPNRHAFHDVGQAAAQLVLQAMSLGLKAHQMAGFDAAKARRTYGIPEAHDPVAAIAVGYPGDPASLPEDLRAQEIGPRRRRPLSEIAFSQRWGEPSAVVSE